MLQLLWTATAASLILCICFAFALRAFSNASAAREDRRIVAAFAHVIGATVPVAICAGVLAVAVLTLTTR